MPLSDIKHTTAMHISAQHIERAILKTLKSFLYHTNTNWVGFVSMPNAQSDIKRALKNHQSDLSEQVNAPHPSREKVENILHDIIVESQFFRGEKRRLNHDLAFDNLAYLIVTMLDREDFKSQTIDALLSTITKSLDASIAQTMQAYQQNDNKYDDQKVLNNPRLWYYLAKFSNFIDGLKAHPNHGPAQKYDPVKNFTAKLSARLSDVIETLPPLAKTYINHLKHMALDFEAHRALDLKKEHYANALTQEIYQPQQQFQRHLKDVKALCIFILSKNHQPEIMENLTRRFTQEAMAMVSLYQGHATKFQPQASDDQALIKAFKDTAEIFKLLFRRTNTQANLVVGTVSLGIQEMRKTVINKPIIGAINDIFEPLKDDLEKAATGTAVNTIYQAADRSSNNKYLDAMHYSLGRLPITTAIKPLERV